MADDNAPPSGNPANDDSMAGVFQSVLAKFLQNIDDMLPAIVIAGDRFRVTVQPQIMMGTTDGQKISRAQVAEVPVFTIGGGGPGGFVLSFPIKPGDLGWIKASDRDISLFMQGMSEEWPNTKRMHSFSDGVFFPHAMREWALNGDDAERVVIQSMDGATRIALGVGIVEITSDLVKIVAPNVQMTGDLQVDGKINADGGVTGAGIVLETHTHPDGTPNTGPPNP